MNHHSKFKSEVQEYKTIEEQKEIKNMKEQKETRANKRNEQANRIFRSSYKTIIKIIDSLTKDFVHQRPSDFFREYPEYAENV